MSNRHTLNIYTYILNNEITQFLIDFNKISSCVVSFLKTQNYFKL